MTFELNLEKQEYKDGLLGKGTSMYNFTKAYTNKSYTRSTLLEFCTDVFTIFSLKFIKPRQKFKINWVIIVAILTTAKTRKQLTCALMDE